MSYRDILKKQIEDLENKISSATDEKFVLEKELNKLKLAEFEEDLREQSGQQLLKG